MLDFGCLCGCQFVFVDLRKWMPDKKNIPLHAIEKRRVRSDIQDISSLLPQLVRACQGHMASQPVQQSAVYVHNYTPFFHQP